MPKRKAIVSLLATVLIAGGSVLGVTSLRAQQLSPVAVTMINYQAESSLIDLVFSLLGKLYDGACWAARKIQEKWEAYTSKEALKDTGDGRVRMKAPKLKRHVNFIALQNKSEGQWTFQVASLPTDASASRNPNGMPESSSVTVFRINKNPMGGLDSKVPIEVIAVTGPGGEKVNLEKGVPYLFYPNIDGKVAGLKYWAKDFDRVVYLEDDHGQKYAFNLVRKAGSGAKATFGVTANSYSALMANKGVEWSDDPAFDDMFFIMKNRIEVPPKQPY